VLPAQWRQVLQQCAINARPTPSSCFHTPHEQTRAFTHPTLTRLKVGTCFHTPVWMGTCFHTPVWMGTCFHTPVWMGTCFHTPNTVDRHVLSHTGVDGHVLSHTGVDGHVLSHTKYCGWARAFTHRRHVLSHTGNGYKLLFCKQLKSIQQAVTRARVFLTKKLLTSRHSQKCGQLQSLGLRPACPPTSM